MTHRTNLKRVAFLFSLAIACLLGFQAPAWAEQAQWENSRKSSGFQTVDFLTVEHTAGQASVADASSFAFSFPIPDLSNGELELHAVGDMHFERRFSSEGSGSAIGLGPVFNNVSCVGCHARDGRGALPLGLSDQSWTRLGVNEAIFLRISIEGPQPAPKLKETFYGAPVAVPGFSTQLFHRGNFDLREDLPGAGQAEVWMRLEKSLFTYPDGRSVELVRPIFKIENPYDLVVDAATGRRSSRLFASDVRTSPRMGPPMIGLGLLELIPDEQILRLASRERDADGVKGIPNFVFDAVKASAADPNPVSLGRFGLKGSTPSVLQQALGALNGDMGVTNWLFPFESIFATPLFDWFAKRTGWKPGLEADHLVSGSLVFYSRTLAVPARRDVFNPDVIEGGKTFHAINCTSCHTPSFTTGWSELSALSNQKIYPFTDMLLHDMGEGLADGRRDYDASGRHWRTRPLWGIGLTQVVNPRAGFMHDGRARTLEEAILWHEGEARASRDRFARLDASKRQQLLAFLRSL